MDHRVIILSLVVLAVYFTGTEAADRGKGIASGSGSDENRNRSRSNSPGEREGTEAGASQISIVEAESTWQQAQRMGISLKQYAQNTGIKYPSLLHRVRRQDRGRPVIHVRAPEPEPAPGAPVAAPAPVPAALAPGQNARASNNPDIEDIAEDAPHWSDDE